MNQLSKRFFQPMLLIWYKQDIPNFESVPLNLTSAHVINRLRWMLFYANVGREGISYLKFVAWLFHREILLATFWLRLLGRHWHANKNWSIRYFNLAVSFISKIIGIYPKPNVRNLMQVNKLNPIFLKIKIYAGSYLITRTISLAKFIK